MKLGWLSTGRGQGSYGLLQAAAETTRHTNLELAFIACTRQPGEADGSDNFIQFAQTLSAPVITLSWRKFKQHHPELQGMPLRAAYDSALADLLKPHNADAAVMAGYMLISQTLHRAIPCLNLHPALPGGPAGTWDQVIAQLITDRATHSGVTIHKVSDELDSGTPLASCRYPIQGLGADEIRQRGLQYERALIAEALKALADGRIRLDAPQPCLDLTAQISP